MNVHQLFEIIFSNCQHPDWLPDNSYVKELELFFTPLITVNNFKRKQLLLSAEQIAGYIYFLVHGMARGFYIDQAKGTETTIYLWDPHSIITDPESFFKQQTSSLFVEVMPKSQLMGISYLHLKDSIDLYPEVRLFSKNVIEQYKVYDAKRNHGLAYLSAWERYLELLHTQPDIEQTVSKGVIASFLCIAPQSLSRMLRQKGHP